MTVKPVAKSEARSEAKSVVKTASKGRTEVTAFKPVTYDEPKDGPKLNEVQLVETFTGDIAGEGRARVLQAEWPDRSLRYCTIERVVGVLGGRKGSFLLQVEGTVQGLQTIHQGQSSGPLAAAHECGGERLHGGRIRGLRRFLNQGHGLVHEF